MPDLPKTPCRRCRCATANRHGYCDAHAKFSVGWKITQTGKTTKQRGYAGNWPALVAMVRKRDVICQPCKRNGFVSPIHAVDHRVPKSQGGTDDPDNLEGICNTCHKIKTQQESKQARQRGLWEGG